MFNIIILITLYLLNTCMYALLTGGGYFFLFKIHYNMCLHTYQKRTAINMYTFCIIIYTFTKETLPKEVRVEQ